MRFSALFSVTLALAALAAGSPLERRQAADKPGVGPNGADFCNGQSLTNGQQIKAGSCSITVQGSIPTFDNMVSTIIVNPKNGATVKVGQAFTVTIQNNNIITGFFDDAATQYYLTPQTLDGGKIQGHQHITIQELTSKAKAPDARVFAFFKGLNDAAVNGGQLSVTVDKGLPTAGTYRICSITGTRGHQPVIMPVAQRGSQDDCIRIKVEA
jgi:transcription initiation factor TFIID subunit 15